MNNSQTLATGLLVAIGFAAITLGPLLTKEWRADIAGKAMIAEAAHTRTAVIHEAQAAAEAAEHLKDADIIRAQGIAEANEIINETLTPEYIQWLFVNNLAETNNQVIYVPTEGGIPVMEAGRH